MLCTADLCDKYESDIENGTVQVRRKILTVINDCTIGDDGYLFPFKLHYSMKFGSVFIYQYSTQNSGQLYLCINKSSDLAIFLIFTNRSVCPDLNDTEVR